MFIPTADVGELVDDVTELLDVDGVAASPATPQVERFDLLSQGSDVVDGVVELLAHVVAMQCRAGVVDACSCLVVLLDIGGIVLSGAVEAFGRCFELHGGGVVVATGRPSAADAAVVEVVLGAGVAPPRLLVVARRRRQRLASRGRRRLDPDEVALGGGGLGGKSGPLRLAGRAGLHGVVQVAAQPGTERFEPFRYDAATCGCGRLSPGLGWLLVGEGAALGDGGDVGAVEGEDRFEGVSGFGDFGAVGDHAEQVLVAATGGGDVQAAAGRHRRDEREAVVDSVGLVAVLGRRIAQPDVIMGVVGGQRDGAVSLFTGHRQRTIGPDRRDGPSLPVADRLAGRGDEGAVVAAGGDDVTDMGALATGDRYVDVRVELSGGDSGGLDGVVDGVDMIIRGGDEGYGAATLLMFDP